ncbi:MAG: diaminopimelate decarboxylase, partial [Aquiluna sp.]
KNPLQPDWLVAQKDLDAKIWSKTARRNKAGALEVGSVPVAELVRKFGSPLYVVDEEDFGLRLTAVKKAFAEAASKHGTQVKLYYASKALLTTEVIRWVIDAGYAVDVSTGGELAVTLAAGATGEQIGLHGNNKSLVETARAVSADAPAIGIDSALEIDRIAPGAGAHDKVQPVGLRVHRVLHAHTHEYLATASEDQKFGVPITEVEALVAKIREHNHLKFLGLHAHIGSQIFSPDGFVESANRLLELHARLLSDGDVPELNLGGGFGIAYTQADKPLAIKEMAERIVSAVAAKCQALQIAIPKLAFEPGRVIAGPAGMTVYTVGTTKQVKLEEAGANRLYVSVDGGMSDNARPALYEAEYSVALASRNSDKSEQLVRIVGKHCESGDIVVRHGLLPQDVGVNDLLAVPATGAYCFSLSSNYNFVPRPAMVAVKSGEARLLVRAETEQDLLARDTGYESGGER